VIVIVVGGTVILVGVAMIVLPGPATVMIPVGLAILATEFVWARRLLKRLGREVNALASAARDSVRTRRNTDRKP
jgi:tellurite resistance protein TerC